MKREVDKDFNSSNKTLLSVKEAAQMYSCGSCTIRKWAEQAGAIKKYGTRVFVVKPLMDRALSKDPMKEPVNEPVNEQVIVEKRSADNSVRKSKINSEMKDLIIRLYKSGGKPTAIANALGISPSSVSRAVRAAGVPAHTAKRSKAVDKESWQKIYGTYVTANLSEPEVLELRQMFGDRLPLSEEIKILIAKYYGIYNVVTRDDYDNY